VHGEVLTELVGRQAAGPRAFALEAVGEHREDRREEAISLVGRE
jgi:hypothetical protein